MKNIYSILSLFLVIFTVSVFGQSRIYAPTLSAPEDLAVGEMPDVKLDWHAVAGSGLEILYGAELADNPDFTDAEVFEPTNVTAIGMVDLEFGKTYYWRVRAFEDGISSEWSETWSFTVLWSITMKTPDDGVDQFINPEIKWEELTGINGYQMQVDTLYAWSTDVSGVLSDLFATCVVAADDIWAVGKSGVVLHFDGTEWTQEDIGTSEQLNDVHFVDATNGFVVGNAGTVIYYDGSTWTPLDVDTASNDLFGVSLVDTSNIVVVGENGYIALYADGSWVSTNVADSVELNDVDMLNSSNIWVCGNDGFTVNYNGSEWIETEIGTKDLFAIDMISENDGWSVGQSGRTYRWDGLFWYEIENDISKKLYGVSFDGTIGYAVGSGGTLLKYDDTWIELSSGTGEDLNGVATIGDLCIGVGNEGTIIRKSGDSFTSPYLISIDIPADTAGWTLEDLLFGTTFYYRLRAFHSGDTTKWSGIKSFNTYPTTTLLSPESGEETDLLVEFEWKEYEGITNYIFEIAADENFTEPRIFAPEVDTLLVNDLVFGQQYFWRVAAQHALDISDWSEVWTITTVETITLEAPENNAQGVKRCPLFDWVDVEGASGYEVWVDTDGSFVDPEIHEVEEGHYQCQSAMDEGTVFYWKVRGKSGAEFSEWSETWSFKTEGNIGINEQLNEKAISIYPNPATDLINVSVISTNVANYTVNIIDISGKVVYNSTIDCQPGKNTISINASDIVSGSYTVNIKDGERVVSKKLLVK